MKKHFKKLLAVVLTLSMVLAMGITAFADPAADPTGSITIKNATAGETYAAYKIFDATVDATDNSKIAYQIKDNSPWYGVVTTEDGQELFTLNEIPGLTTGDPEVKTYNVVRNDGVEDADIINLFKEYFVPTSATNPDLICKIGDDTIAPEKSSSTLNADGITLTLESLPYGYYYVTSTLGSVLSVDSVNTDPEIVDKNQEPSWDNEDPTGEDPKPGKVIVEGTGENAKKVTANEVKFGDTVSFDIGVNATNFVNGDEQVTWYLISDKLAPGFTVSDDFAPVVTVNGTVISSSLYSFVQDANNKNLFEINIKWATVEYDTDGTVKSITSLYPAASTIHVTYSATLNDDAVIAGDGNPNVANFTYLTDKVGEEPETPPTDPQDPEGPDPTDPEDDNPFKKENKKETTTYTYALGITKVEAGTNLKLADAHFSLNKRTGAGTTEDPYQYTKMNAVAIADNPGYYKIDDGISGAVTLTDDFVTNSDGVLVIEGLDEETYYFIEEKAPNGYNILTAAIPVQAKLTEETTYTTSYTTYYDKDGKEISENEYLELISELSDAEKEELAKKVFTRTYSVNTKEIIVENNKGTELPSTGGIGTTILYVIGGILILGAAILLITRKRMRSRN